MASETFEQVLLAAQAEGSFTPAWRKFVNTRFYVAIELASGNDRKNFTLHVEDADGKPAVTISELRERIDAQPGNALVTMSGAEVVRRLHAEADILVALSDRAFNIARDRVEWLKKGIEAAQLRAAERASLAASSSPAGAVVVAEPPAAAAEMPAALADVPNTPSAALHSEPGAAPLLAPALSSLSTLGRLGRTGVLAYLLPLCIGAALFGVLAATLVPRLPGTSAIATAPTSSKLFTAADGSFSVILPGVPDPMALPPEMASQLAGITLHQYQLVVQDNLYMLQSIDYADRMPDTGIDAMDQMQASVIGKDGRLIESKAVQLKGTTGRQVKVALPNGGVRAARFAILGSKFFMVSISAPDASRAGPAVAAFLDSFKLN